MFSQSKIEKIHRKIEKNVEKSPTEKRKKVSDRLSANLVEPALRSKFSTTQLAASAPPKKTNEKHCTYLAFFLSSTFGNRRKNAFSVIESDEPIFFVVKV
jgi:hypothetical protein